MTYVDVATGQLQFQFHFVAMKALTAIDTLSHAAATSILTPKFMAKSAKQKQQQHYLFPLLADHICAGSSNSEMSS